MRTNEDTDQVIDLGDAVIETKGSQAGKADLTVGERIPFMGLADDD